VVIGGGYAGASVAMQLSKTKEVDVTIITPRDFVLNKIGGLRAAVAGKNWVPRALIPNNELTAKGGKLIRSMVTSVDPAKKTVTLTDGQVVKWDALVVASGSRNFSPADPPASINTKEGVTEYWSGLRKQIQAAKSIVIVGGGSVGLELAGEIRDFGPKNISITIVSKSKTILAESSKYKQSGLKRIEDYLKTMQVNLILHDEVQSHSVPEDPWTASPIVATPGGVTLKSGKTISSDLLIFTVGSKLNTRYLPAEWLDKTTGELDTDPKTLQLLSRSDVFGVGDASKTNSPKRAYFAVEDGKVVAKNVLQALKGKAPTKKIQRMNLMVLTLGATHGFGLTPLMTLGHSMTTMIKSKDLFSTQFWKSFAPKSKIPPIN